jgi:SP family general alpha glucoside:H+ symporter-like MFS transporter
MIERTIEIEAHIGGTASLLDLWKGTDLRRTVITCLVYASQNFAGNLIANQATFFFERAGMDVSIPNQKPHSPKRKPRLTYNNRQTSPSNSA